VNRALPRPGRPADRVNPRPSGPTYALAPEVLATHRDLLYRAARRLGCSHHEAEDLVQEMFAQVLKRPRLLRHGHEVGHLLRALRNTHISRHRASLRRPLTVPCPDTEFVSPSDSSALVTASEVLSAIAGVPEPFRETVLAINLLGLSYEQAAAHLETSQATIISCLARGRRRSPGGY
jgi:RNA polymerase sigma-70 factor, ECF subfamily